MGLSEPLPPQLAAPVPLACREVRLPDQPLLLCPGSPWSGMPPGSPTRCRPFSSSMSQLPAFLLRWLPGAQSCFQAQLKCPAQQSTPSSAPPPPPEGQSCSGSTLCGASALLTLVASTHSHKCCPHGGHERPVGRAQGHSHAPLGTFRKDGHCSLLPSPHSPPGKVDSSPFVP